MRKPRDIDAELRALQDKARSLKARKIAQLGELVTATGADAIDAETLAGILLEALDGMKQSETKEAWRQRGAAFFQRRARSRKDDSKPESDGLGAAPNGDGLGPS